MAILQQVIPDILNREGPEVIREKGDPTAARLAFGAHVYSEPFRRLSLLPRLLAPVCQLLPDEVYLHQSRINPKQGFGGGAKAYIGKDIARALEGLRRLMFDLGSAGVDTDE